LSCLWSISAVTSRLAAYRSRFAAPSARRSRKPKASVNDALLAALLYKAPSKCLPTCTCRRVLNVHQLIGATSNGGNDPRDGGYLLSKCDPNRRTRDEQRDKDRQLVLLHNPLILCVA
jgi:hypothetical protein